MGTGKRALVTTAVTVVCAVTLLAAPGTAFAAPDPGPSVPVAATPAPSKDLQAVRARLDALYHDAAVATDAYNAAEEASKEQSSTIVALAQRIVDGRERLAELKDRAGAAARAQYRSGGLPDEAKLILSEDPSRFLDDAGRVRQGQKATTGLLAELTTVQADLEQYARDAAVQWQKLEAGRKAKAAAQKRIEQQIAAAKKLEAELAQEERVRLAELERQAAQQAQTRWAAEVGDTGVLGGGASGATAQGEKAVDYALAQRGKPYEWGAEGPLSYDCSGLTSQAWAGAGTPIPRTSQEQWRRLKHVDVQDMRPGDLIVYFSDASHVAMYIGEGKMVHAPRPGRSVTVAGAGSMPILGVVRPDA
ncbi:C40 family peptidase [Streptomyces roseirectus]|uniref:C40 family peptidase n=1 Tax=Streptomyces roseirectus TaxID=2768066 RepID=A0A7H0IGI5_9ACTN|nr:NlpC/P60 family protein [Streptomyces roseirectus]QNP71901.1 C40 family peptidase [Streptomyces roseirectus]